MHINNKTYKNAILFVISIFLFFVLASAVSTVSAVDLTGNDTEIITNTEDVNIVDQDLSNINATIDNTNLNIQNSKLNNSKLANNGGNVSILDSTIKNSNLTFNNNDEIIIKNTKFYNTIIEITGVNTLYLVNCSFINSNVDSNATNLLTIDLMINQTSNVNLTAEHIWANGVVFVNDHSNFHLNVTKTRSGIGGYTDNNYYDYYIAFPKANELAGFNSQHFNYQLILVNGSSNATGYINGTVSYGSYYVDFLTFASQDSNDSIDGAFEITDHNSNSGSNIDFWVHYGIEYFKLPNGTIVEIIRINNFQGYNIGFYLYNYIDSSIYNNLYYNYTFESINYTFSNWWLGSYGLFGQIFFYMMWDYDKVGFTNNNGALVRHDYDNYYIFYRWVNNDTNILKIFIDELYNMTYEMNNVYYNDWQYHSYEYYWDPINNYFNNRWISSLQELQDAHSGDIQYNNTNYQNVFLYQNIRYVDENGTVLSTEDMNIHLSLLTMQIWAPYNVIKYYYETYGIDGILMLLNVNMSDQNEVDQERANVEDYINELNQIIDEIVIDEMGIDIWKTIVVPSNSTIPSNTTDPSNSTNPGNTTNPGNSTIINGTCDCGSCNTTNNNKNNQTIPKVVEKPPVKKVDKKVDLAIVSIKKIKSSNKKNPKYKITIINKGNIKSKATLLSIFHKKNGIKIKNKYFKVKSIGAGKKISIIVDYYPDRDNHRYCKAYYTLDPKNKNKETKLANNKKTISLKY